MPTKTPKIIGLTGQKRSGKSTTANLCAGYTRLSFAGPLKGMLRRMGLTDCEMEDKETVLPRFGRSPRYMMQTLGTEWGRNMIDGDLWIGIAKREAWNCISCGYSVVYDDVRFDNEAQMIRELGGEVRQVVRGSRTSDGHVSEKGIDPALIDQVIYNHGSNDALIVEVRARLHALEAK